MDISFESLLKEVEKLKKKDLEDKIVVPKKDKRTRREILEEYLIALIIQSDDPKVVIEENKQVLTEYKFETLSLQKLLDNLILTFTKNEKLELKQFAKSLSQELVQAFDTCYIFPLPKFLEDGKSEEEAKKVARELFKIFLKDKLNLLSVKIKTKEQGNNTEEVGELEKELAELVSLLPKN